MVDEIRDLFCHRTPQWTWYQKTAANFYLRRSKYERNNKQLLMFVNWKTFGALKDSLHLETALHECLPNSCIHVFVLSMEWALTLKPLQKLKEAIRKRKQEKTVKRRWKNKRKKLKRFFCLWEKICLNVKQMKAKRVYNAVGSFQRLVESKTFSISLANVKFQPTINKYKFIYLILNQCPRLTAMVKHDDHAITWFDHRDWYSSWYDHAKNIPRSSWKLEWRRCQTGSCRRWMS